MEKSLNQKKRYRFLTGPDDAGFCQRVSDALEDGYVLYGGPVMVVTDEGVRCGQAVVLPDTISLHHQPPSMMERHDR